MQLKPKQQFVWKALTPQNIWATPSPGFSTMCTFASKVNKESNLYKAKKTARQVRQIRKVIPESSLIKLV